MNIALFSLPRLRWCPPVIDTKFGFNLTNGLLAFLSLRYKDWMLPGLWIQTIK